MTLRVHCLYVAIIHLALLPAFAHLLSASCPSLACCRGPAQVTRRKTPIALQSSFPFFEPLLAPGLAAQGVRALRTPRGGRGGEGRGALRRSDHPPLPSPSLLLDEAYRAPFETLPLTQAPGAAAAASADDQQQAALAAAGATSAILRRRKNKDKAAQARVRFGMVVPWWDDLLVPHRTWVVCKDGGGGPVTDTKAAFDLGITDWTHPWDRSPQVRWAAWSGGGERFCKDRYAEEGMLGPRV